MVSPIWRCWSCRPLQVPLSETECSEVEHRVCEGLLHRGQHMHGALPISSGQRWNLIVWMRASQERNKLCPMCNKRPTLVEGEGFADGFTKHPATPNPSCALTWRADAKKAKRVEVSEGRCVADGNACCCLENDLDSSRLNSLSGDLTDSLIDVEWIKATLGDCREPLNGVN